MMATQMDRHSGGVPSSNGWKQSSRTPRPLARERVLVEDATLTTGSGAVGGGSAVKLDRWVPGIRLAAWQGRETIRGDRIETESCFAIDEIDVLREGEA